MNKPRTTEQLRKLGYKDGDNIEVKHVCTPNLSTRTVTVENGGIRVKEHWFSCWSFFEVNFIP